MGAVDGSAMKLTVKVEGVEGIETAAKYVKRAVAGALEAIAIEGAIIMKREARALCPVLSGKLQKSIRYETMEKTETSAVVRVRPHTSYAARVEYGYQDKDRSGRQFHQPAQPYMRPAFDGAQQEAREAMIAIAKETITDALVEAANRQARKRRG